MRFSTALKTIPWLLRLPSPIRELLISLGLEHLPLKVEKRGNVLIEYLRLPCRVIVGKGSYGHIRVFSWERRATIRIGNFTSIASVTIMLGGEHHYLDVSTYPFKALYAGREEESSKPRGEVNIGNDVWFGRDVFILDNLTVGDGAVLAARSVLTRDVPPYAVVAGNPATVKKYRFADEEIRMLLESKWWELPEEFFKRNVDLFYTRDVKEFVKKVETAR
jgi:acetyltransferase-like isoleucine patch superfamily enzyme